MKLADKAITVGSLAKRAGVSIDTIRYYERRGLLAKPARSLAGYRTYGGSTVQRLRFIRNAQALGFTLSEIEQLLTLHTAQGTTCDHVRYRAQLKLADIERKIRSLDAMKKALQQLVSACKADGPTTECSFLGSLSAEESP